jgi:hypothetical protein
MVLANFLHQKDWLELMTQDFLRIIFLVALTYINKKAPSKIKTNKHCRAYSPGTHARKEEE